jgi:vacuolar protein-sorting-associated protein 4
MARTQKPAVIFIDEIDSLCGTRVEGENDSTRRIKTEFLVQMQGGPGIDNDGILVLGATNVPWNLDPAVRRRFEKRIYIPLPDAHAREVQFKLRLGHTPNNLTEEDFQQLGEVTEGYSGSDVSVIIKEAMMMPLRRCQNATKFKIVLLGKSEAYYLPTYPTDPAGIDTNLNEIDPSKLLAPDVTADDVFNALSRIKPSVSPKDIQRHIDFTTTFGQDG